MHTRYSYRYYHRLNGNCYSGGSEPGAKGKAPSSIARAQGEDSGDPGKSVGVYGGTTSYRRVCWRTDDLRSQNILNRLNILLLPITPNEDGIIDVGKHVKVRCNGGVTPQLDTVEQYHSEVVAKLSSGKKTSTAEEYRSEVAAKLLDCKNNNPDPDKRYYAKICLINQIFGPDMMSQLLAWEEEEGNEFHLRTAEPNEPSLRLFTDAYRAALDKIKAAGSSMEEFRATVIEKLCYVLPDMQQRGRKCKDKGCGNFCRWFADEPENWHPYVWDILLPFTLNCMGVQYEEAENGIPWWQRGEEEQVPEKSSILPTSYSTQKTWHEMFGEMAIADELLSGDRSKLIAKLLACKNDNPDPTMRYKAKMVLNSLWIAQLEEEKQED